MAIYHRSQTEHWYINGTNIEDPNNFMEKKEPLVREMCSLPVLSLKHFIVQIVKYYYSLTACTEYTRKGLTRENIGFGVHWFGCKMSHLHVYSGKYMFVNMNYALNTSSFTNRFLFALSGCCRKLLIYTGLL